MVRERKCKDMTSISPKNLARDKKLDDPRVDEVFRRKAEAVLRDVRGHGLPLVVVEVYRTKARALLMKAQGKSQNGTKSKHCQGRAMDCAFDDGKGGITWNVPRSYWEVYGKAAKAHELTWGDDWHFRDTNHIELS